MKVSEIELVLVNCGWVKNKHGNFESASGKVRIKMQATSLRVEKKWNYENKSSWINVCSDYYKNLSVKNEQLVIKGHSVIKQNAWRDLE